eukprot:6461868-Amphidinium_carterae.2
MTAAPRRTTKTKRAMPAQVKQHSKRTGSCDFGTHVLHEPGCLHQHGRNTQPKKDKYPANVFEPQAQGILRQW